MNIVWRLLQEKPGKPGQARRQCGRTASFSFRVGDAPSARHDCHGWQDRNDVRLPTLVPHIAAPGERPRSPILAAEVQPITTSLSVDHDVLRTPFLGCVRRLPSRPRYQQTPAYAAAMRELADTVGPMTTQCRTCMAIGSRNTSRWSPWKVRRGIEAPSRHKPRRMAVENAQDGKGKSRT